QARGPRVGGAILTRGKARAARSRARHGDDGADAGEILAALGRRALGGFGAGRLLGARARGDVAGRLVGELLVDDARLGADQVGARLPVVGVDRTRLHVGNPFLRHAGGAHVLVDQALPGGAIEPGR